MSSKIKYGDSISGDVQKNTWTFEMEEDVSIKGGRFAIIDVSKLSLIQLQQFEEFINNL